MNRHNAFIAPIRNIFAQIHDYMQNSDKLVTTLLAVFIGVGIAYAAIGFRLLVLEVQDIFLHSDQENILLHATTLAWWQILLATVSGGLIISVLIRWALPDGRLLSIAEVIEANALRDTRISLRQGLASALAAATALGAGSAGGREGPVVHLGATLSAQISRYLHLSPHMARTILGCGVAAAVSASFNAPIAGVFFALEVILGHYALHAFAPIVISSVAATIVTRIHLGDFPAFILPDYQSPSPFEFPAFVMLGVVCALTAIIFIKSLLYTENFTNKLPVPRWALPPIGGLGVGLIAIIFPAILGVGYGATDAALKEMLSFELMLMLIVAKTAATAISLAFRFGVGVFSPSLFLGAMVGGAFGFLATAAFPDYSSGQGLYAIVGMAAVASATLGAPISTLLMIFELTGDYQITLALMAAVVVANLITNHYLKTKSLFFIQLAGRGIYLEGGRVRHLLRTTFMRELMKDDYVTVGQTASQERIRELFREHRHGQIFVLDEMGRLSGMITFADVRKTILDENPEEEKTVTAADMLRPLNHVLVPSDNLETAFKTMERAGEDVLPVVTSDAQSEVVGIIHHKDVLMAYNRALTDEQSNA